MIGNHDFQSFGDALLYYRKKEGLSQEQLSEGICSREYIGQIEKGKKIPTLHIIHAFSLRMDVNLFDVYALIIHHTDFDTHLKIEQLDDIIYSRDDVHLYQTACQYADLPGFSHGVPYQHIMQAYAIYYSNVHKDYEKAIYYASEGLKVSGLNNLEREPFSTLANEDMCLLTAKAVALCRSGHFSEGRKHLEFLHECTKLRFIENRYIANRNRRFDINMFALTTYNICEFFQDDIESNLKLLDDSISLLDKHECSCYQSQLLLYKARYLYDQNKKAEAQNCFNAGYYLLICRKSQAEADECARDILKERYDSLKNPA